MVIDMILMILINPHCILASLIILINEAFELSL